MVALGAASVAYGQDAPKRGRKYKAPPPTSHVEVTVLRSTTGKPLPDAAVIFHPLENGHDNGNMELKTDEDGKAKLDLLVTGSNVRIQVIADGWQTFGQDYKIDKDNVAIEVKLSRPVGQYSIYKKDGGAGESKDASPNTPKSDSPKADTSSDTAKGTSETAKDDAKPQDSTAQPK